jgi:oligopeptide/dipeptide ABC transporter ATP-binding protein
MAEALLVKMQGVRVWFPIRRGVLNRVAGHVRAVDGVWLDIAKGEALGLVGESGCGKTTLGRALLGLETIREGQIFFDEKPLGQFRSSKALRKRMQMVFQDPFSSLNPRMAVMDILTEGMAEHRMLKNSREEAARTLLLEVGLDPDSVFRYPHEFSGGQRQRINIARALSLKPELMVCDEAVSALDVSVQAQIIELLLDLAARHGLGYLFISHDLAVVARVATRIAVMYLGKIVETGPTGKLLDNPLHPYTQALLSAVPEPGRPPKKRIVLLGDPPSPASPPPGCAFHTRCPKVMDICKEQFPPESKRDDMKVFCHLYS